MKFVAVTSCPTGIAHTYMAAESLEQAAEQGGHELKVETQGAAGSTPLAAEDIAGADAVLFAADVDVRDAERFAGKPTIRLGVKQAINNGSQAIADAVAAAEAGAAEQGGPAEERASGPVTAAGPALASKVDEGAGFGTRLRQWLMTGVSYMIPFVAAGGILMALSFMIGGAEIAVIVDGGTYRGMQYPGLDPSQVFTEAGIGGLFYLIGSTAFDMLVPILSGFIAFGMADRPGIAPGVVGGLLAVAIGAGFLGGLASGLIAGGTVMGLKKLKVPQGVAGVMPVVVIPLLSSLAVGALMIIAIGDPIAAAQDGMTAWLTGLSGGVAWLLGGLLGLMMGFDLGGPVNKVAYTFGLAALASGNTTIMAAVMAAGMVPPLGLALASFVRKHLFTRAERQAGQAGWLLGLSFITEGAIPFAAADPVRVIPSSMLGGAVAGALSVVFGAGSLAPHGGIWVIGLIDNALLYLLAIAAGMLVTAGCVLAAKKIGARKPAEEKPATVVADTKPVTA